MATGFPFNTGDILTSAAANGLVTYSIGADITADYTAVLTDQYQVLEVVNKSTAIAYKIPTNASVAFPIGTVITILNKGAGVCTISADFWHYYDYQRGSSFSSSNTFTMENCRMYQDCYRCVGSGGRDCLTTSLGYLVRLRHPLPTPMNPSPPLR